MTKTRTRRTPKPRTRRGEAKDRIVAAAVEAFAEKGFEAASTREIAQRAGTDQGLVTYHFPSKDLLWRAAADQLFGVLGNRLGDRVASLAQADPRERIRGAIREYVRWVAEHPEFFRFLVDEGNLSNARTRWLVDTHIKPRFEFMKEAGLARAAGIDEAAIPHAFFALSGAAGLIFAVASNCRRLTGLDPRKREAIEAHADFVADLLVR
jgi:TetR/AcrR family transcriptional regulator